MGWGNCTRISLMAAFLLEEGREYLRKEERYQANPDFISREIAGEFILVPVGEAAGTFNGLASLNPAGVFLWKLLAQPRTRQELSDALAKEYELTGEQGEQDVGDFLDLAMSRNLVLCPAE